MNAHRIAGWIALSVLASILPGCATRWTSSDVSPDAAQVANVLLYLSDEGPTSVDFEVYLDGRLAVQRTVASLYSVSRRAHGNPDEVPLSLASGQHALRVVARTGSGTLSAEARFVVSSGTVYVSATYWPPDGLAAPPAPNEVKIRVQDHRFGWC